MSIVVVAARPSPLDTAVDQLGSALRDQAVTAIVAGVSAADRARLEAAGLTVIGVAAVATLTIERPLRGSALGRTLLRLTPADRGVRLARRVRADAAARRALDGAEVLVAAERDAILTVWRAARRAPGSTTAVVGLPALAAIIRRRVRDGNVTP